MAVVPASIPTSVFMGTVTGACLIKRYDERNRLFFATSFRLVSLGSLPAFNLLGSLYLLD